MVIPRGIYLGYWCFTFLLIQRLAIFKINGTVASLAEFNIVRWNFQGIETDYPKELQYLKHFR